MRYRVFSSTVPLVTEFLADWDWPSMSSLTSVDLPGVQRDATRAPHIVWDTPGVSVQGWSGHTAYALNVIMPTHSGNRLDGVADVLERLDDVLKTISTSVTPLRTLTAKAGVGALVSTRAYEIHQSREESVFLLAHAETQGSATRLRVVLWNQDLDAVSAVSSAAELAVAYAKLTWQQLEPKALMADIAAEFDVTASSIDGVSTASIVAESKGQALSVFIRSRFVWWFTFFAMVIALMFATVIVLLGGLPASGLLHIAAVLVVGAWGLVTTRRNWRRREGR